MITKKITTFAFVFLTSVLCATYAFGASLMVVPQTDVNAQDVVLFDVFVDSKGEVINSVEGTVLLSGAETKFKVIDIVLGQSAFSLWPRSPSLSADGTEVSFIGGVPGGVKGERVKLFSVAVSFGEAGEFTVAPKNFTAYLNDGNATVRDVVTQVSRATVGVSTGLPVNNLESLFARDNTPPQPFKIELITDSDLYGGKKFLSFNTYDNESGLGYFEVQEGEYPKVRTGNTYVLIDQSKENKVIVKAYDRAGNFQKEEFVLHTPIQWSSVIFVSIILVLVRLMLFFKKRK